MFNIFEKCLALSAVHISDIVAWCNIKFDPWNSNPLYYTHNLYLNNAKVTDLVIPEGVDSIKDYAFNDCLSLTSVTIGNSVTSIGDEAFSGCYNLKSATIGDCVTSIADGAFHRCSSLTSITIPSSVTSIGDYAFACDSLSLITCLRITPPSANDLGANTKKCTLMVPKEAYAEYLKHEYWGQFLTIKPLDSNIYKKIDISVNDSSFCNINIVNGYYCINDSITITATPNKGFHFTQWSDGNTENPRTIVITQDTTFTAEFAIDSFYISGISPNGTIEGTGRYAYNTEVYINAIPNKGYHFIQWLDGNTDNPRNIVVTQDSTFTAQFAINTYNVTLSVENGSAIGRGEYNHGEKATLIASPNKGYHFTQWSDGNTDNPRIVIITQDSTFTAIFEANSFSISTDVNDDAMGSVTEGGEYTYGTEITLTAIANEGYFFVKWSDEITDNPRTVIVTEDKTYIAEFRVASTSVENTTNSNISIFTTGNTLHIESATTDYYILDAAGRLIYTGNGNTTTLTLPRGIYLITIGGEVEKIVL